MSFLSLTTLVSSVSFIIYGVSYFYSPNMKNEFKRFGLEKFGVLTAVLEIAGGVGLLVGFVSIPILLISSGGLALLMLLGFFTRLRVKDSLLVSLPSFTFMLLNAYIFCAALA